MSSEKKVRRRKVPAVKKTGRRDTKETLERLLMIFRASENTVVAVFLRDDVARRIVGGWQTFPTRWRIPTHAKAPLERDPRGRPLARQALWEWIWRGLERDRGFYQRLSAHCGVEPDQAKRAFDVLRANRVLYPDGSISSHAQSVLSRDVLDRYHRKGQS